MKSDNDGDDESQEEYERRDTKVNFEKAAPKSALKFRLSRKMDDVEDEVFENNVKVETERPTAVSMASMMSEKIEVGQDFTDLPHNNDTGARRSYIFNDYRVEETYAGPGKFGLKFLNHGLGSSPEKNSIIHIVCIIFQLTRLVTLVVSSVDPSVQATYASK